MGGIDASGGCPRDSPYVLELLETLPWSMSEAEAVELLQLLPNYLLKVGNIEDVNVFIEASTERLSGPARSEIITFEEQLENKVRREGRAVYTHY